MKRITQIEAELHDLEARRDALIRERTALLIANNPLDVGVPVSFSHAEKIALFLSLFRCRNDVFPKLWENSKLERKGYSPACRNEWHRGICEKPRVKCSECFHQAFPPFDETAARDHLTGKHTIGTYAIREDNTCIFLATDFDGDGWEEDIRAYRAAALVLGIEAAIERSRSGNGGHAWIFFSQPVPALIARRLGTLVVAKASSFHPAMTLGTYDRFFPNQDSLPAGGFGNLIALPLQAKPRALGNTVFLDENLAPHSDQWAYLASLRRTTPHQLDEVLQRALPTLKETQELEQSDQRYEDRALDLIPEAITRGVFTGTGKAVRHAQLEINTVDLPTCLVAALKRLATMANPEFFEKQRLRFGTYNIPRFIFCGEIHPDRLVLPRGSIPEAESLFRKAGGRMQIEERRPKPSARSFEFRGELISPQQSAVRAVLLHEDGVLVAPPGAGKTVMGCAIIASRKVSTLVLVHRKPLLDQWRSRLQEFLGVDKNEIGVLGQAYASTHPDVVVGMVQTLSKSPNATALLEPFTQVIVDECHHIPATSFEAVMKVCPARFFLGLTATPIRKDGLQKILFLQCGPIRHRMDPAGDGGIPRMLILHDIHLGLPPEGTRMQIHQVWDLLANHEARNKLIVSDIASALAENRNCAVLSDRKEHLAILCNLLTNDHPKIAERVLRIDGSMGKKQRAAVLGQIDGLASNGSGFALLATSSLLGEGFDLPLLDTLFLTLPISFKGRLIQYAGRLHRANAGKTEVRIHDYVETDHPLTAHMARKRMAAYRSMGYEIGSTEET
ncbi:DEAD/DEAH box helicase family protein [Luteolibacter sp. LG18]|uniref:TOTE conflict system archaeo-eukaryotic primase domain-containing protein n=1 Tax=Luteolibacter sp. LG18 TaxID=2819286 RepID=UPI002B2DE515|nr:helicase [Luteolibacter sp. LG18]